MDRKTVRSDENKRVIDLQDTSIEYPQQGIYEGGIVRYFGANSAWLPVIVGFIEHLAELSAHGYEINEDNIAIQAILEFQRGIEIMIQDCNDVEDCLETSQTILEIENTAYGSGASQSQKTQTLSGAKFAPELTTEIFAPVDCGDSDRAKLWGAISEFIDYCHEKNFDLIQYLSNALSLAQMTAQAISAIPLIGLLPIDETVSIVSWLSDYLLQQYNVQTTVDGLYQTKCSLFCAAVANDCNFTVNDAFQYFESDAGLSGVINGSVQDLIGQISPLLSLQGMQWFSALTTLQLAIAAIGAIFVVPVRLDYYVRAAKAGSLAPNSGYLSWCTDCPEDLGAWKLILDFAGNYVAEAGDIVLQSPLQFLQKISGVVPTQAYGSGLQVVGNSGQEVVYRLNFSNLPTINRGQINWRSLGGTQRNDFSTSIGYNAVAMTTTGNSFSWSNDTPISNANADFLAMSWVQFEIDSVVSPLQSQTRYIRISGTGPAPIIS